MVRRELLDAEHVRRHADAGAVGIVRRERIEDGAVLALGVVHGAVLVDGPPQARPGGAADERFDDRGERGIAARVRDESVEGGVDVDRRLEVDVLVGEQPLAVVEDAAGLGELLVRDEQRRTRRRLGLERAPHAEQVHAVLVALELGEDSERLEQPTRFERRHVGAVALPGLEHPEDDERAHPLAQRTAGDAEAFAELALDRQARTGDQLSVHDHLPDAVDHDLRSGWRGLAHGARGGGAHGDSLGEHPPRTRPFIRSFDDAIKERP